MHTVQRAPVAAVVLLVAFLAVFQATVGLGVVGWTVGLVASATAAALLAVALHRAGRPGSAWPTASRWYAPRSGRRWPHWWPPRSRAWTIGVLLGLTALALVLDAVGGRVARRTHSVTRLGARFDMETDAFLILVLSVAAGPLVGWWVLAIGLRPRVAARRARPALAPVPVPPPVLAQGGRRGPGRHAGRRRHRCASVRGGGRAAAGGPRAAGRVVRAGRRLAGPPTHCADQAAAPCRRRRSPSRRPCRSPGPAVPDTDTLARDANPPAGSSRGPAGAADGSWASSARCSRSCCSGRP